MKDQDFNLESMGLEKGKLACDILHSFHTQFAENQRTREQGFLKILGFLGVVIFGYAYVYDRLWQHVIEFSFVTIASELILMFGALIITTIAYNFRRDQYINARIRRSCGILGVNRIFPEAFDPSVSLLSRWRVINWMPNFLGVFFWVFPIFQILLYISFAIKLKVHYTVSHANAYVTSGFIVFIISISTTIGFTIYYFIKLRTKLGITKNNKTKDAV